MNHQLSGLIKIYSKENKSYLTQLGYVFENKDIPIIEHFNACLFQHQINTLENNNKYNPYIHPFENIDKAIEYIKSIRFYSTIIIVSGSCFVDFVKKFHKNIKYIYIMPKIIRFTLKHKNFELPKELNEEGLDVFYKCEGIQTDFIKIKEFIEKKQEEIWNYPNTNQIHPDKPFDPKLIFEQVKQREELILPGLFNKTVLQKPRHESNNIFNEYLCRKYVNDNNYTSILSQIVGVKNIPTELLCKYYARIYTIDGKFFSDMKKDLLEGDEENFKNYKPFIKTLYEGCERGALKTFIKDNLYSAQFISEDEVKRLQNYIGELIPDCPSSFLFTKSFMSFSKNKEEAEKSFIIYKKNAMLTMVEYDLSIYIFLLI